MQRVGVIGTGIMGAGHARYLTHHVANAEVVALSDIDLDRANALASELGTVKLVTKNVSELMESSEVDAIVIASPDQFHVEHIRAALKTGKPTLSEKPIATNLEDAEQISKEIAARQSEVGKRLVVFGFMRRFDPAFLKVRELIASGKYGKPLFVRVVSRNHSTPGVTSSGMFTNMAIHDLDIYRWLFKTEWASIQSFYPTHSSESPSELADPLLFIGKLENGVMIVEDVMANAQAGYDTRAEVVCELGNIEIGVHGDVAERHGLNFEVTKGGAMETNWLKKFNQSYINELNAWIAEIETGVENPDFATHTDALIANRVGALGVNSL